MPDFTSALLVIVIIILTTILIIFSAQIFFILRDFHKSLKNLDKILVNLGHASSEISQAVSSATLVAIGTKIIASLINLIHKNEPDRRT